MPIKLSVVLPIYNQSVWTYNALCNLKEVCKDIEYEVVVVNDWSIDNTKDVLAMFDDKVKVWDNEINEWVTNAWNRWVSLAKWEYVCVINNDLEIPNGFFEKLMNALEMSEDFIMAVPCFTNWLPEEPKSDVRYYANHWNWHCRMIRRKDWKEIGPIDERLRIYYNDNWLFYRVEKDLEKKIVLVSNAICHHYEAQSTKWYMNTDTEIRQTICKEKWRSFIYPTVHTLWKSE